ncbi:MAG: MBL fold metallo-hydrolase [Georgenia sp.]
MRLTHFGHACLLVETTGARLLFDPGTYAEGFETVRDLDGVLLTHQHADHVDRERLPALLTANPHAVLLADEETAALLTDLPTTPRPVRVGDHLTVAGAEVDVVGGAHAFVYGDLPALANAAYVLDGGAFFHPGDSLVVPEMAIDVLAGPTGAPWLKLAEAIDFVRAVRPRVVVPIHERTLADPAMSYSMLRRFSPEGTTFSPLPLGERVEV